jgi:tetratricopeptide (TPR) repeat protein
MEFEKNKDEITKTGKENSIVTRNTSLIILDRVEDYVKYHIVPTDEFKEKYYELVWKEKEAEKKIEKDHIEEVVAMFDKRQEWWNKEFKFGTGIPVKEETDSTGSHHHRGARRERDGRAAPAGTVGGGVQMQESRGDAVANALAPSTPPIENAKKEGAQSEGSIVLKKWEPQTPYLDSIRTVQEDKKYDTYLELKRNYSNSSAFYLDMADFFMEDKQPEIALRILSNIAEMELENPQLLRILAYRLQQLGYNKYAILIFEEVLKMRPEEPQSFRDLALAYAADKQFQKAVDLLYNVIKNRWDTRFPEIELIALSDFNDIIANCNKNLNVSNFDTRLVKNLPVDMRVILTWDADNTDIDLWVTDPNGEKCFYSNPDIQIGGHLSRDFTRGYGPEEFLLKKAQPGEYKVEANYYGNTQQVLAGATTIQLLLITNFGRPEQKTEAVTMRLKDKKEVIEVGKFIFKAK